MVNFGVYFVKLSVLVATTLAAVIIVGNNSFDISELLITAIVWRAVTLAVEWVKVGNPGA